MKSLLTISAAARTLCVGTHRVRDLIKTGHLPAIRLSEGVTRVSPDALEQMVSNLGSGGLPPVSSVASVAADRVQPLLLAGLLPWCSVGIPEHVTVTQILARCGAPHAPKCDLNAAARWLRQRGYREVKRRGTQGFIVQWRPTRATAVQGAERLWGPGGATTMSTRMLLTIPDVARMMRLPKASVRDLIRVGHLPVLHFDGGRTRVRPEDLDSLLSAAGKGDVSTSAHAPADRVASALGVALVPMPLDPLRTIEHVTVTNALIRGGLQHISKRDTNAAAVQLRELGYKEVKRNGARGFIVQWRSVRPTAMQEAERLWGAAANKS